MSLIATNVLGQNTPAIAATEADYGAMWAQDAGAMYEYAAASAAASALPPFTSPPPTTNPLRAAGPVAAVAHASATPAGTGSQLLSAVPMHLRDLRFRYRPPKQSRSFLQLLSLLSPVNLAVSSASTAITSTGTAGSYAGLGYAVHYDPDGAGELDAILARLGAVPEGSGTSASASLGSAELGAASGAAPVLPAGLGRASSIGALSVPPGWAAATPPIDLSPRHCRTSSPVSPRRSLQRARKTCSTKRFWRVRLYAALAVVPLRAGPRSSKLCGRARGMPTTGADSALVAPKRR